MNYVKYVNGLEKDMTEEFYNLLCRAFIEIDNQFEKMVNDMAIAKGEDKIDIFIEAVQNMGQGSIFDLDIEFENLMKEVTEGFRLGRLYCNTKKDWNILYKRFLVYTKSLVMSFNRSINRELLDVASASLEFLEIENKELLLKIEIFACLTMLVNICPTKLGYLKEDKRLNPNFFRDLVNGKFIDEDVELCIEIEDKPKERPVLKKIFNWREMESLALSKGYIYNSSNGDHRIYKNSEGSMVVIPAHTLGLGLSYKIQKDIYF